MGVRSNGAMGEVIDFNAYKAMRANESPEEYDIPLLDFSEELDPVKWRETLCIGLGIVALGFVYNKLHGNRPRQAETKET